MRQKLIFTLLILLVNGLLFSQVAKNNALKGHSISDEWRRALMLVKENTLTDEIIPEFDSIGPLCAYSMAPALPDTSLNDVTGTWAPPTIDTSVPGVFVFTFTPDPGQNAVAVSMEIAILPEIIPVFGAIGLICQYSVPPPLPDTTLNGITGSWNPPTIDTDVPGIFTSTFTPDLMQCAVTTTMGIEIYPVPIVNAGADQAIPHGTSTTLQGSAYGGGGSYAYHWEPAIKLVDPNIPNPQTVNLYATTVFTLSVTDLVTGCQSAVPDQVSVIITGDALSVNPIALPEEICQGETVQLYALAGGGSGIYAYNWTSNPPGFISALENPILSPINTITFLVSVSDGYNIATGSVVVTVNQNPIVNLGDDILTCVSDTVMLSAWGNPGSSYVWSTGSNEQSVKVFSADPAYDMQTISVTVISPDGCFANDECVIVFDLAACSGIDDPALMSGFINYPNPFSEITMIEYKLESSVPVNLTVFNHLGQQVAMLADEEQVEGKHQVQWDAKGMPIGLYFYRLTAGRQSSTGKMVVVR